MEKKIFAEKVAEELRRMTGGDVFVSSVFKNNEKLTAFSVSSATEEKGEIRVCPTLYLEDYMWERLSPQLVACTILEDIRNLAPNRSEIHEKIKVIMEGKYDGPIRGLLVRRCGNEQYLDKLIYREFLDLALIYYIELDMGGDKQGTIKISKSIAEAFGWEEEDLFKKAMETAEYEADIETFTDIMYKCSTVSGTYGAVILMTEKLREFSVKINEDLILFPVSVHEVAAYPAPFFQLDPTWTLEEALLLVKDENQNLDPSLILSDSVYYYESFKDEIRIATEEDFMPRLTDPCK